MEEFRVVRMAITGQENGCHAICCQRACGRSNRLTRFDESALPEPGGAFSWVDFEARLTSDLHPDAPDRTVSCPEWWQPNFCFDLAETRSNMRDHARL